MPSDWRLASGGRHIPQAELDDVARELLEHAGNRKVWLFFGEMGSGKTTLIKAIAHRLGVTETMSSPTFSIVNEYAGRDGHTVYHMDLFRLKNEKEVTEVGMDEYFSSNEFCFVEWPEKLGRLTPGESMNIRLTPVDFLHRKIEYQPV